MGDNIVFQMILKLSIITAAYAYSREAKPTRSGKEMTMYNTNYCYIIKSLLL